MEQEQKIARFFSFKRILIPVLLGLGIASYLIYRQTDWGLFDQVTFTFRTVFWLFMALVMMVARDIGYILRLRMLTNKEISFKRSFQVIMLWEFASALTPSVVGGSAVAMLIINREKIPIGRATAVVMITALLDELFYLITVPIVLMLIAGYPIFSMHNFILFGKEISSFNLFLIGYLFMLFLTIFILYAVFFNARGFKYFLLRIFRFRWLRKWKFKALRMGNDVLMTSKEMKQKSFFFWCKAFGTTFFSWTARFWIVNCLILAFLPVDNHLHIYATQLVMWVIMLISPTPGSSGVAELIFTDFLSPFLIVGLAPVLAVIWRLLSYYVYLIAGSLILPIWLRRVFSKTKP
jgi:glycosyltransferase 2 family protein